MLPTNLKIAHPDPKINKILTASRFRTETDLSDEPSDKHHELVHAPLVNAEPLPTHGAHKAFDEQQGV